MRAQLYQKSHSLMIECKCIVEHQIQLVCIRQKRCKISLKSRVKSGTFLCSLINANTFGRLMYVKRTHEIKVLYILHKYKCYTLYNITHIYNVMCRLNKNRIDMIVLKWVRPYVKRVCNFSDRDIFLLTDHRRRRAAKMT